MSVSQYNFKFRLSLSALLVGMIALTSCDPDEPEPGNGGGEGSITLDYLTYSDNGQTVVFNPDNWYLEPLRQLCSENGAEFMSVHMDYQLQGEDFGSHLKLGVSIPLDSSNISQTPIGFKCLVNDSTSWATFGSDLPGSLSFEFIGSNGTDENVDELDTLEFYNKILSIEYAGNHHYNEIEQNLLCEYKLIGEFRLRVTNDISGQIRVLENGQYQMTIAVLAQ